MPVSNSFLNSHKRKYVCDNNDEDNNKFIQNGQDKKFKYEEVGNNEINMDLSYLFEMPITNNNSNNNNQISLEINNHLDNKIINNPNFTHNNNIIISNNNNNNYDNDHMMDEEENHNLNGVENTTNGIAITSPTMIEIAPAIDMKQNFSFWKYHVHDSYFHCRSHYF